MDPLQAAARLAAALSVGLIVGLERGWRDRDRPEGGRVAGLRTFALIGLLGGVLHLEADSPLPLATGLAGVALLFAVSFGRASSATGTLSITSAVAALVTFGLGALAAAGQVVLAVGAATVVALLLGMKGELHQGMRRIHPEELNALLQLGVVTAAILPLLPDEGFGPYRALNPF
ncbi:MAG TPA: MgtC/SapB family protein, partial [Ramlibacter sp.]